MNNVADVEAKFEAHRKTVKTILEAVEAGDKSSDEGFKAINEILTEVKTIVGIPSLV